MWRWKCSKLFQFLFNKARGRTGRLGHRILCTRDLVAELWVPAVCQSRRGRQKSPLCLVLADVGTRHEKRVREGTWPEELLGRSWHPSVTCGSPVARMGLRHGK